VLTDRRHSSVSMTVAYRSLSCLGKIDRHWFDHGTLQYSNI